jgi:hypothetical protein
MKPSLPYVGSHAKSAGWNFSSDSGTTNEFFIRNLSAGAGILRQYGHFHRSAIDHAKELFRP